MNTKFVPRLHVLLASESPLAVVLRRGPSKQVCTVLWDRSCDSFSMGQWFKGVIFERRSDLSPDGKYLIYFAMNGQWQTESRGSWTAISRAPYLKAIVMLPKGGAWNGGGLFTERTKYWLNDGSGHSVLRDSTEVQREVLFFPKECGNECLGVYVPRLLRDGWTQLGQHALTAWHSTYDLSKRAGKS